MRGKEEEGEAGKGMDRQAEHAEHAEQEVKQPGRHTWTLCGDQRTTTPVAYSDFSMVTRLREVPWDRSAPISTRPGTASLCHAQRQHPPPTTQGTQAEQKTTTLVRTLARRYAHVCQEQCRAN
jgi:hypothetical protein